MNNSIQMRVLLFFLTVMVISACSTDDVIEADTPATEIESLEMERTKILDRIDAMTASDDMAKGLPTATTILLPDLQCGGFIYEYSRFKYVYYAHMSDVKPYDRKVDILIWKGGSPMLAYSPVVKANQRNSEPLPFAWDFENELGQVVTMITNITNMSTRTSETNNYTLYGPSFYIKNCYSPFIEPWDPGYPNDCDNDGINNDLDEDDNGNGVPDIFEPDFRGC